MTTYPTRVMSRVPARGATAAKLKTIATSLAVLATSVLYTAAYCAVIFYGVLFLDALGADEQWRDLWTHGAVAVLAVVLTVVVLRFAAVDVRRRDDRRHGVTR